MRRNGILISIVFAAALAGPPTAACASFGKVVAISG
jgi:hypothetical protein